MSRAPTTFSRVSTGYKDSNTTIALSSPDLGFISGTGTELSLSQSLTVGGGSALRIISTVTRSLSTLTVPAYDASSVVTTTLSNLTRGDLVLIATDSPYAASDSLRDVTLRASSTSTVGVCGIWAVNSTQTQVVIPNGTIVRLVRFGLGSFI